MKEEVVMNALVELREGVVVCGTSEKIQGCFCLRGQGHQGHHVALFEGNYVLFMADPLSKHPRFAGQVPSVFSCQVTAQIAQKAIEDTNWRWDPE